MCTCLPSCVCLFWDAVDCNPPGSSAMRFSRQEPWRGCHAPLQGIFLTTQSCPTLCDPMSYTVHGILQARILEWVTFPFSRGSSQPRDQTQVSLTLQADSLPAEPQGKPKNTGVGSLFLYSRSSWPRNWTGVFCAAGRFFFFFFFTNWAIRDAPYTNYTSIKKKSKNLYLFLSSR